MERKNIFVVPSAGASVFNPETGVPLPDAGARVRASAYWERRRADGSVSYELGSVALEAKTNKKPGGAAVPEKKEG
jgi:hypothetical protein